MKANHYIIGFMSQKSIPRSGSPHQVKAKRDFTNRSRGLSGSPKRSAPKRASLHRGISAGQRAKSRKAQVTQVRFRNPFRRLIQWMDRMDWRYKIQLTIGLCLVIVLATYLLRERISALGGWGYLGAFIVNGISNATIILPAPGGAVVAIMAQDFNPLLIGISAGLGGTVGGSTAYVAGLINSSSAKKTRWFRWLKRVMKRFGGVVIFTFALIPFLPGDLASLVAGGVRYRFHKYLLYNGLASMIKMTAIAYMGSDLLRRLELIFSDWIKTFS